MVSEKIPLCFVNDDGITTMSVIMNALVQSDSLIKHSAAKSVRHVFGEITRGVGCEKAAVAMYVCALKKNAKKDGEYRYRSGCLLVANETLYHMS